MDKTAIMVILDKSGSMGIARESTINGFNEFLAEQKKDPTPATMSLIQFDDFYRVDYIDKPLAEVQALSFDTYAPSGNTALYDAVGRGIDELGDRLRRTAEAERPDKVIVLIITDGAENKSKEISGARVREMIELQQKTYSWNFVFLGANIDAYKAGAQLGIQANNIAQYSTSTAEDVAGAYKGVSNAVLRSRSTKSQDLHSRGVLSANDKSLIERPSRSKSR